MATRSEADFTANVDQLLNVVKDLIRLKPRLKVMIPKNLSRVKERLTQLHPEGGSRHYADFDLFYRIGLLLQGRKEPLSMGDLGEKLNVPLSTATRMVDWLVESAYLRRLPDPEDRRIVRVALSGSGKELYRTITGFIRQRTGQILKRFSREEQVNLVALLQKLLVVLEEATE